MNPTIATLNNKISELENISGVTELDIVNELQNIRNADDPDEPCSEWKYEILAFIFFEKPQKKIIKSSSYYGPMATWETKDGETVENPNISSITQEVVEYWEYRSEITKNPLLKARYTGLLWELSRPAIQKPPNILYARDYINTIILIAENDLHKYQTDIINKLGHALSISISINDKTLINRMKHTILNYENRIAEDSKPGLWGFCFDFLIDNPKIELTEDEEKQIISDLESRLLRLSDIDPWNCEKAVERLANFYRKKGLSNEIERVSSILGNIYEKTAENSVPTSAIFLLEHMHRIYLHYNFGLAAEELANKIRILGPKMRDSMHVISGYIDISQKELNEYTDRILKTGLGLEESLSIIAALFITKKDIIQQQIENLKSETPLTFYFSRKIIDDEGRIIANVGSLSDDLDGNIAHQMAQTITIENVLLSTVIDKTIEKFNITSDDLVKHLLSSPIILEKQTEILHEGISAYFNGDYNIAIHLLIPQIEASIRNLVEMSGGTIIKSREGGGFHLKTLDDLLRSQEIEIIYDGILAFYLRTLLTDQRGLNIRNEICHGTCHYDQLTKHIADRVIHVFLVFTLLHDKEN